VRPRFPRRLRPRADPVVAPARPPCANPRLAGHRHGDDRPFRVHRRHEGREARRHPRRPASERRSPTPGSSRPTRLDTRLSVWRSTPEGGPWRRRRGQVATTIARGGSRSGRRSPNAVEAEQRDIPAQVRAGDALPGRVDIANGSAGFRAATGDRSAGPVAAPPAAARGARTRRPAGRDAARGHALSTPRGLSTGCGGSRTAPRRRRCRQRPKSGSCRISGSARPRTSRGSRSGDADRRGARPGPPAGPGRREEGGRAALFAERR
jgi:hypothetical protein